MDRRVMPMRWLLLILLLASGCDAATTEPADAPAAATLPATLPATAPATRRVVRDDSPEPGPMQKHVVLQASDAEAIDTHLGIRVTVEGVVKSAAWSRSGKVCNIEFEGTDESKFFACLFERSKRKFDDAFGGDLATAIVGRKVRVRGLLDLYGGRDQSWMDRTQIILSNPGQLEIVE